MSFHWQNSKLSVSCFLCFTYVPKKLWTFWFKALPRKLQILIPENIASILNLHLSLTDLKININQLSGSGPPTLQALFHMCTTAYKYAPTGLLTPTTKRHFHIHRHFILITHTCSQSPCTHSHCLKGLCSHSFFSYSFWLYQAFCFQMYAKLVLNFALFTDSYVYRLLTPLFADWLTNFLFLSLTLPNVLDLHLYPWSLS